MDYATVREGFKIGRDMASLVVPTNWTDPLLTGPGSLGKPPWTARDIEQLLRGIIARIRALECPPPHPSLALGASPAGERGGKANA